MSCDHLTPSLGPSPSLLVTCLVLLGVVGACLNSLVVRGVRGNPRLATSINYLLTWICGFCLLESTLGITVRSLIIGRTVYCLGLGGDISTIVLPRCCHVYYIILSWCHLHYHIV